MNDTWQKILEKISGNQPLATVEGTISDATLVKVGVVILVSLTLAGLGVMLMAKSVFKK